MTTMIQGDQVRALLFGVRVEKAAATLPVTGTPDPLFTVAGGRVLITSMVGEVTTVVGGTTPSATVSSNPTVGADSALCAATAIGADPVGTLWSLPGLLSAALNVSPNNGAVAGMTQPVICAEGTIDLSTSAADTTGAAVWALTYVPLDNGASVVAAA